MLRRWAFALLALVAASGCSPGAGPVTSPPAAPLPTTSQLPEHGEDANDDTPPPPVAEATTVVAGFAEAWTHTSADPHTWWEGVVRWCEEGLADKLRSVDPGNVPARTIAGQPQSAGGSAADGLRFHVPTNSGTLQITVGALGGRWKVTAIDFDRSPR